MVYVSRPQVSTTAKVPSLVGLSNVNDARTLLVQNKLGLGSTTEQYSDKPAGTIIGQDHCRRFHRQGEQPRQRDRQRRGPNLCRRPGRGARQHLGERKFQRQQLRRRLVERPCGRWLFLLQRLFRFQLRHQPERLVSALLS